MNKIHKQFHLNQPSDMSDNKRIHQLDLNLLKVFKTLYAEQNMTRAADLLHLTPSAVSHAVKRLRFALDDELFVRSQNKMVPTPACQRMAPTIIENLTRLQQALLQWGHFDAATSDYHFTIGMHHAFEPSVLPQLAKLITRRAPNVGFSSIKVDRANIERELAASNVDVVIDIAIPVKSPVKRFEIFEAGFKVLMRQDHPFANNLSQKNYLRATHITVSNRPSGMTAEDTLFQEQGVERKSHIRCQNYFAARELLRHSNQLLTVPKLLAMHLVDDGILEMDAPFDLAPFPTSLYWHEHTENDAALRWLRDLIIEEVRLDSVS